MSTTKHTAEPWEIDSGIGSHAIVARSVTGRPVIVAKCEKAMGWKPEDDANAARIVACVNACAKFPDPAVALTDLRLLLGQARGLLAEGDTDKADKMLVAMLGVLDGEEG